MLSPGTRAGTENSTNSANPTNSLTPKIRFPLFEKCRDAFLFVLCREADREQVDLATEAFVEIRTRRKLYGFLAELQGDRGFLGDLAGELHGLRFQFGCGMNVIYQPELQRGFGVDHVARQDHLHRPAFADQTG